MKRLIFAGCGAAVAAAMVCSAETAYYIGGGNGTFNDPARWLDAYVPQAGDTAVFLPSSSGQITVPDGSPFTLSSMLVNTNVISYTVAFYGETNTLVAPAVIAVSNGTLAFRTGALAAPDGFTFVGRNGNLELLSTNLIAGTVTALSGRIIVQHDLALGPVPAALAPAAITLDGGMLGNLDPPVTIHPNRGITAGPNGAYLHGRNINVGASALVIESPITGPGSVTVIRQTDEVEFRNAGNDYSGDTVFGAAAPVGYYSGTDQGASLLLLGADEVIPHGEGKGRLVFVQNMDGVLNLNGHTETVNGIAAANAVFAIVNGAAGTPGVLRAGGDISMNGVLGAGVTVDYIGAGTLRFVDVPAATAVTYANNEASAGTFSVASGSLAFADPALLGGGVTVALNGGGLALELGQPGLAEYRSAIPGSSSVNPSATPLTFGGVFPGPRMANAEASGYATYTQYLYEGEWFVPADGTYSFGKGFDDGAALFIDGQLILLNNTSSAVAVVRDIALTAGWHTLQLYVSQGGGSVGPRTVNGFVSAIVFDPANGPITNGLGLVENAYPFADPGDGSVLRTRLPSVGTARARLEINEDAAFDRSAAPALPIVWANDVVAAPGATLTVTGGSEPFTVGSPVRPAVFEANISDANGIRFQDKVWVKTLPADVVYGAGADLAVGIPGILGTGAQNLTSYSLRLPDPDALGDPADAPVTVNAGRTLTFDSTTERDARLIDDPDRAFTASNAVILAGGTLAFDGPGTVTLDAPVSGSGALVKSGSGTVVLDAPATFAGSVSVAAGTLSVSSDASLGDASNPVSLTGGTLDLSALATFSHAFTLTPDSSVIFPGAPFTLTGALSGTLRKTGDAPLTLAGSAPNPDFDLYVSGGAVTLANTPGPAVRNILGVDAGASLTLDGADQISGSVRLTGGVFDLAGNDLAVDSFRAYAPSAVTNSASGLATLTVGTNNTAGLLIGALAPNVALSKQGSGGFTLAAVPGTSAPASVDVASGLLALGRAPSYVRLTILKTRTAGQKPRLGELVLTRDGYPLPYRTDVSTLAPSSQSPYVSAAAVDGTTGGFWLSDGTAGQYLIVDLKEPVIFNGYRLYSGTNVTSKCSSANDPVSWTLEISSDNSNWLLVDTVADAALYSGQPGVKIMDRTLDPAVWPSVAFDAATPVTVAAGASLRAATSAFPVGTLSGAGTFEFLRGASATLGDLSAFTGVCSGAGEMVVSGAAPFDIPSSAVPAPLSGKIYSTGAVTFPPDFPTVRNGAAPASVVVGASGADGSFAGRLAQAAAPLGLTKVGAGKTILVDAGSTYTGDTVVEAGTLAVQAGSYTFRYIRFNPTLTQSGNQVNSGYALAISEFQLLRGGQPVVWPSGTTVSTPFANHSTGLATNAINGSFTDRWLSSTIPNPLTIDTKTGVTFDAYRFYDSAVNPADTPERCPVSWTLEVSDDGATWMSADSRSNVTVPPEHGQPGQLVGTFPLRSSPRAWLPAQFRAATPVTSQFLSAVTASKFCFQVLGVRTETTTADNSASGYALTELQLLRDGAVVPWPAGTTVWSPVPGWNTAIGNPANMANNNAVASDANRFYSSSILNHVVINARTNLTFDAYRWVTAYNVTGRDPTHWRLMVMPAEGGDAFYPVDEQVNYPTTTQRGGTVGPFPIIQPAGLSAVDAIPDTSRVRIAQDAMLELGAGVIETVGPLSGTGTVSLVSGATLGLNLFEDAVFDGAVNGAGGTLALAGGHAQFFTSAHTIPGDFAVDFRGGRFGGTLRVGGALTVTGPVAYAQPARLPYGATLFTFSSIDTASREALIAGAASLTLPSGYEATVRVTADAAYLSVAAPGTVILLR